MTSIRERCLPYDEVFFCDILCYPHITCIRQSQATKSQHWQSAKQWASYSQRKPRSGKLFQIITIIAFTNYITEGNCGQIYQVYLGCQWGLSGCCRWCCWCWQHCSWSCPCPLYLGNDLHSESWSLTNTIHLSSISLTARSQIKIFS